MIAPIKTYWFPAKRYGWGWGVPTCWQGWAVLAVYLAAVMASSTLAVAGHTLLFYAALSVSTAGLLALCRYKGEPPRWRWGGD
jgi:hypothetical protein